MKVEIELPDEIYIAAMAVSEIKGFTLDEYMTSRITQDELVEI